MEFRYTPKEKCFNLEIYEVFLDWKIITRKKTVKGLFGNFICKIKFSKSLNQKKRKYNKVIMVFYF